MKMEYPIKINARINQEQYDRIMDSGVSKSEYVREAIEFFNSDVKRDVELSKLEVISEIKDIVDLEQEKFEDFVKKEKTFKESIQNTLQEEYDKCNIKLKKIEEEEKKYSDLNIVKPKKITTEEVIMTVLPTIQGFYRSETGITYDKLRNLAFRIDVNPQILKDWVDQNEELVQRTDYMDRPTFKHEDEVLREHYK